MDLITIFENQNRNMAKLESTLECLKAARLRKVGIEKWNTSAIWFSDKDREHDLEIIEMAIARLQNRAYKLIQNLIVGI